MALLEVDNLSIGFRRPDGTVVEAVRKFCLTMERGEGVALVGESGSGKSVTALALARLLPEPPAVITGGTIRLDGASVLDRTPAELRRLRGRRIGYIFQEPSAALNPVFSVRSQMVEVIAAHRPEVTDRDAECIKWLDEVGIVNPAERLHAYPHQLSGGMQQRVMIAMALAAQPDLLVADEPTTALDVTIQAQIMQLLARLKQAHGMAVLLITHNFGIIRGVADRVAVMYRGDLVETGTVDHVLRQPGHAYTKALLACIPRIGQRRRRLATIENPGIA